MHNTLCKLTYLVLPLPPTVQVSIQQRAVLAVMPVNHLSAVAQLSA